MKNAKHVTLISPPSLFLNIPNAYPPMGLMYLGRALEEQGFNVTIVDLCDDKDWKRTVQKLKGEIFGITLTTAHYNICEEIVKLLPAESVKVVGGVHPTVMPEETYKDFGCHTIVGEGEMIFQDVLNSPAKPKIWYGGLIDVDRYPIPARHLVDMDRYMPEMTAEGKTTTVYTSRGCPFNCAFCSRITGNTIRWRSVSNVLDEIRGLIDEYGVKNIVFGDDNFLVHRKRTLELIKSLPELGVKFKCIGRSDVVDKEYLQNLKDAGCTEINFGVETGSQRMLDLMGKRNTVKNNRNAILLAKEVGMAVKAFLMVGFPGEDEKSVKETKDFILETMPDKWLLSQFVPLPACDVWLNPKKYGITWMSRDWDDYYLVGKGGSGGITFETKTLTREKLLLLHDELYIFLKETLGEQGR